MTDKGFMVVDEKDWNNIPETQKSWMLFNTLQSIDERLTKIENRTLLHKSIAFIGGVIGGIMAVIGSKLFGG